MSALRRNNALQNVARARDLRKTIGRAEKRLWYDGLAQRRLGFYFRRQVPMGPYFLDFYCTEAKVCVEVDGEQHEFSAEYDARRDRWLAESEIVTLRFATDSVMVDLSGVLYRIRTVCEERVRLLGGQAKNEEPAPTLPSPTGVGEAPCLDVGGMNGTPPQSTTNNQQPGGL